MDIYDYFDGLQRGLRRYRTIGFFEGSVLAQAFEAHSGMFRARFVFWDSSHLTIDEVISTQPGYPEIVRYAYTYIGKDNRHIFRYDNAPHFREFDTFPHHKHLGPDEKPSASSQPTLGQVFDEIQRLLEEN
jgi:hypothetical protein